jgi:hypothetical protein
VTRIRAADDFSTIRARMQEQRPGTRPRAADDFVAIRARIKELRRERAQALAEAARGSVPGPRPKSRQTEPDDPRLFPRTIVRRLLG